jgi:hypothetical protein
VLPPISTPSVRGRGLECLLETASCRFLLLNKTCADVDHLLIYLSVLFQSNNGEIKASLDLSYSVSKKKKKKKEKDIT